MDSSFALEKAASPILSTDAGISIEERSHHENELRGNTFNLIVDGNETNLRDEWSKMDSPSVSMGGGKRTEWSLSVVEKAPRSMKLI